MLVYSGLSGKKLCFVHNACFLLVDAAVNNYERNDILELFRIVFCDKACFCFFGIVAVPRNGSNDHFIDIDLTEVFFQPVHYQYLIAVNAAGKDNGFIFECLGGCERGRNEYIRTRFFFHPIGILLGMTVFCSIYNS